MGATNGTNMQNEDQGPKLEDFLGCCYSSSPADDETKVYCQNQPDHHNHETISINKINVNLAPSFNTNNGDIEARDHRNNNHTNTSPPLIHSYTHYNENPQTLIPNNAIYKSWLGQTPPFAVDHHRQKSSSSPISETNGCNFQSLSLTMSPSSSQNCGGGAIPAALQVATTDSRKRAVGKFQQTKEPVPRKSIDTFGQRTSQFRGVTRYYSNDLTYMVFLLFLL